MTTGKHSAKEHPDGKAVDWSFARNPHKVNVNEIFKLALQCGFKGVGIYYNQHKNVYRFHFDLRKEYGFWSATRDAYNEKWIYKPLIMDPK